MPPRKALPIIIDGANELSLRGAIWVLRRWSRLKKEMTTSEGYLWHHVYFRFPFTLGLTSYWQTERAAYKFAQLPVHTEFRKWAEENPKRSLGGWLAVYEYQHGGALWGTGVTPLRERFDAAFDAAKESDG